MTPHRHLNTASAIGICTASMIGSGIFTITGLIGPALGSTFNLILAWILAGILSLAGAFTAAELAANRPVAGALYVAARETLGERLGFVNGVVTVLVGYIAASAFIASVCVAYLDDLFPGIPSIWTALALVALLSAVHARWLRSGTRLNDCMAAIKIAILLVFALAGLIVAPDAPLPAPEGAPAAPAAWSAVVGAAVVGISFAYLGWSAAADVASEVRNPARALPAAILGSIALVTTLYVLVNLAYVRALVPAAMLDPETGEGIADIGAVAATRLFGGGIGMIMTVAIALVLLSTLSTMVFTGSRVLVAMSEAGELPGGLQQLGRHGAPTAAVWTQAILIVPFIVFPTLGGLLEYIGLLITLCASMSGFAVLIRRARGEPRHWSMPLHPLPVVIFLGLSAWLAISAAIDAPLTAAWSALTLLAILAARPLLIRRHRLSQADRA